MVLAAPGETGAEGDGVLDWPGAVPDGEVPEPEVVADRVGMLMVPLETGRVATGTLVVRVVGRTAVAEEAPPVGTGMTTATLEEVPTGILTVAAGALVDDGVGTGTTTTAVEVEGTDTAAELDGTGTGTTTTAELDGIGTGTTTTAELVATGTGVAALVVWLRVEQSVAVTVMVTNSAEATAARAKAAKE